MQQERPCDIDLVVVLAGQAVQVVIQRRRHRRSSANNNTRPPNNTRLPRPVGDSYGSSDKSDRYPDRHPSRDTYDRYPNRYPNRDRDTYGDRYPRYPTRVIIYDDRPRRPADRTSRATATATAEPSTTPTATPIASAAPSTVRTAILTATAAPSRTATLTAVCLAATAGRPPRRPRAAAPGQHRRLREAVGQRRQQGLRRRAPWPTRNSSE